MERPDLLFQKIRLCPLYLFFLTQFVLYSIFNERGILFQNAGTSVFALKNGGDDGNRTHDPLLAGQVLSQLSYTPIGYSVTLLGH